MYFVTHYSNINYSNTHPLFYSYVKKSIFTHIVSLPFNGRGVPILPLRHTLKEGLPIAEVYKYSI